MGLGIFPSLAGVFHQLVVAGAAQEQRNTPSPDIMPRLNPVFAAGELSCTMDY